MCSIRSYTGIIDLELAGNTLTGSLLTPALVTFTRNEAALNPSVLPKWQYLPAAKFVISDRDGTLADAWIGHPEFDPFLRPVSWGRGHEGLAKCLSSTRTSCYRTAAISEMER